MDSECEVRNLNKLINHRVHSFWLLLLFLTFLALVTGYDIYMVLLSNIHNYTKIALKLPEWFYFRVELISWAYLRVVSASAFYLPIFYSSAIFEYMENGLCIQNSNTIDGRIVSFFAIITSILISNGNWLIYCGFESKIQLYQHEFVR